MQGRAKLMHVYRNEKYVADVCRSFLVFYFVMTHKRVSTPLPMQRTCFSAHSCHHIPSRRVHVIAWRRCIHDTTRTKEFSMMKSFISPNMMSDKSSAWVMCIVCCLSIHDWVTTIGAHGDMGTRTTVVQGTITWYQLHSMCY